MIRCEIRRCGNVARWLPVLFVPGVDVRLEGRGALVGATAVCDAHRQAAKTADYVSDHAWTILQEAARRFGVEIAGRSEVNLEWLALDDDSDVARDTRRLISARQRLS